MLPDLGWTEMLVIAVVLIVVIGPKDLPKVLRGFGRTMTSVRKMAGDFRKQFDDALKDAELDDVRQLAKDVRGLDPRNQIREALNPLGELGRDLNADIKKSIGDLEAPEKPKSAAAAALDDSGAKARQAQEAARTPRAKVLAPAEPGAPPSEPTKKTKADTAAKPKAAKPAKAESADKPVKPEKPAAKATAKPARKPAAKKGEA